MIEKGRADSRFARTFKYSVVGQPTVDTFAVVQTHACVRRFPRSPERDDVNNSSGGTRRSLVTDDGPFGQGGRRVGDVIRLDLPGLVGRGDDQSEILQASQAVDDRRAGQLRAPHEAD